MNQVVQAFTRNIHYSRTLGTAALTGFEALASCQFDHAQSFATRSSTQVRAALSKSGDVHDPVQLPELMRDWIGGSSELVRDAISSSINYQLEMLRLVRKQVTETREALAESIAEPVTPADRSSPRRRHATENTAAEHSLQA